MVLYEVWETTYKDSGSSLRIFMSRLDQVLANLSEVIREYEYEDIENLRIIVKMSMDSSGNYSKQFYDYLENNNIEYGNGKEIPSQNDKNIILYTKEEIKKYMIALINEV